MGIHTFYDSPVLSDTGTYFIVLGTRTHTIQFQVLSPNENIFNFHNSPFWIRLTK